MSSLENFRSWSYSRSPAFGLEIDKLIRRGSGLGDASTDLSSVLDSLANGLQSAASTVQLSLKDYYDAATQVKLMQQANAAGVPVDLYTPGAVASNINKSTLTPTLNTLMPWLLIGGVFYLLTQKHARR